MKRLLPITLAALWCRLNLTVTALLQHPLQRLRALAPSGDQLTRSTPPYAKQPLTPAQCNAGRNTTAVRHVLTGSLLLAFGMLTMLALPVESHDNQNPHGLGTTSVSVKHSHSRTHTADITDFFGGGLTAIDPEHFEIEWIRIYKNPKITKLADFTGDSKIIGEYNNGNISVIRPAGFGNRRARLYPSLLGKGDPTKAFWVDIDPGTGTGDGYLLDDPEKRGNSGLVDGPGVTVIPGDIVAIAIRVKLKHYKAVWEPGRMGAHGTAVLPLGPTPWAPNKGDVWARNYGTGNTDGWLNRIAGGTIVAAVWIDGVGVMNPNYPLESFSVPGTMFTPEHTGRIVLGVNDSVYPVTHTDWGHNNRDGYHTLVYQFTVPAESDAANTLNDGDWFDGPSGKVSPFNVPYGDKNFDYANARINANGRYPYRTRHDGHFGFLVPFGANAYTTGRYWGDFLDPTPLLKNAPYSVPYNESSNDIPPGQLGHVAEDPDQEVAFSWTKALLDRNEDSLLDYLPVIDDRPWITSPRHYNVLPDFYDEDKLPHHFPPTYDTAKGTIYYPTVVGFDPVTPEIVDVPETIRTGDPFQVTLRFQRSDENARVRAFALDYDTSPAAITALQDVLTAAFASAGTVTQVELLGEEDALVQYQVTVVPAASAVVPGFLGEMTLQVPADAVTDRESTLGNLAASVTVPIDIPLPLVDTQAVAVVAPASGTYLAGDALTVEVSFATDGLSYEGENPPYVTIYLGAEEPANARHAVWEKGSERSGSTIVPFVYTVHAEDPIVSSVSVDIDSSDSLNSLLVPRETTLTAASGINRPGTADPAAAAGAAAPVSDAPTGPVSDPPPAQTFEVQVQPVIYIPQEESDPKAAATVVPRSPIVFNEIGNGSGDANDWLELRNVSGSDVSLKGWELSVVADGKKEDTSLIAFPEDVDVSVPANGLLLITNMPADKTPLAGGANKGLSHASLVNDGLSLPDDGKFLLILRNAKEKLGLNEAFIDVAGGGGSDTDAFVREQTGDYDTHVWPLQVLEAPGDNTEDALSAGKVWVRAKADIVGYHKDAWGEAAFTGLGYDRKVSDSPEHAGTPGYPNGAVKTGEATPKGAVTFSEIMFDTAGATLPQWIELYNASKTEALNLNRWKLEIQNRRSADLVGRPIVTLTLQEKVIQPNQTLLIVAGDARASSENVFPADRVYNLLKLHDKNLRIKKPQDAFLSAEGFYLKLSDSNGTKIDEIGNLDDNRRTDDAPRWVLPMSGMEGMRSSLVRRYTKGVAEDGMERSGWAVAAHFKQFKVAELHYGHADDIGTPGYRQGGALPVELSSFTVSRTDAGAVIVTWTTESEVDNAGFNLRRSLKRDSGFTLLNPTLIAGAGTTGERQTYTFTDTSAKPGVEYYYQIEEVSFGGKRETLVTRRLAGPVSPANRALTTFGEVKKAK